MDSRQLLRDKKEDVCVCDSQTDRATVNEEPQWGWRLEDRHGPMQREREGGMEGGMTLSRHPGRLSLIRRSHLTDH